MIRFIFIALFLVLYLILSCPIMLILLLVRKINAKKADIIMQLLRCHHKLQSDEASDSLHSEKIFPKMAAPLLEYAVPALPFP